MRNEVMLIDILVKTHQWLIEKALLIWIKFESVYHTKFLRPSNLRDINIELQISLLDFTKDELIDKMLKEFNEWYIEKMDNFSKYFSIDEFTTLKGFIQWTEIHLRIDGLDSFKDLFLLINNEKKSKLKGFISFFVNILQVVKTLRFFNSLSLVKLLDIFASSKKYSNFSSSKSFQSKSAQICSSKRILPLL